MINRGAMQQPQFGMPLNFYENQTSHASASQFQSAFETDRPVNLVLAHLHIQVLVHKVRLKFFESIMEHQQIELWWGTTRFYRTHQNHLAKLLRLMLPLML
jgi:hypothetical protein